MMSVCDTELPEYNPLNLFVNLWLLVLPLVFLKKLLRSLKEIRSAIPPRLFVRDTKRGLAYMVQDLTIVSALWYTATYIDPIFLSSHLRPSLGPMQAEALRWMVWII